MQSQVYNVGSIVAGAVGSSADRLMILISGRVKVSKLELLVSKARVKFRYLFVWSSLFLHNEMKHEVYRSSPRIFSLLKVRCPWKIQGHEV